jgi:hypothetical protein
MEEWNNRLVSGVMGSIVVRQGFDGELSRTAHHPEEDRGAV